METSLHNLDAGLIQSPSSSQQRREIGPAPHSTIYLDCNATTPMLPEVWEAMRPHLFGHVGNPASAHAFGRQARRTLEDARERVAVLLNAHPDEVVFTSGATEANNLAIFGLAGDPPGHLLASAVEHPSVVEPLRELKRREFEIDFLPVEESGRLNGECLDSYLHAETRLVCLQLANHETGAVHDVVVMAGQLPAGVAVHCDAAQAVGRCPVDFHALNVATLALSGHKFHGPPGMGALLVRRGVRLHPLVWGGHQQQGRRPGTEAVALAVGLATALDLAHTQMAERLARVCSLRVRFLDRLHDTAAPVVLNGPAEGGMPHTLNLSFPGCRAESLLMNLDLAGVACSTGSACASGSLRPSPVLEAMRVSEERLHTAMRFSLSFLLKEDEVDEVADRIARVVKRLRNGDQLGV